MLGLSEIRRHPRQAKEVDDMSSAFEITEEMVKPEFIPVVGGIGDQRGQYEEIHLILTFFFSLKNQRVNPIVPAIQKKLKA